MAWQVNVSNHLFHVVLISCISSLVRKCPWSLTPRPWGMFTVREPMVSAEREMWPSKWLRTLGEAHTALSIYTSLEVGDRRPSQQVRPLGVKHSRMNQNRWCIACCCLVLLIKDFLLNSFFNIIISHYFIGGLQVIYMYIHIFFKNCNTMWKVKQPL